MSSAAGVASLSPPSARDRSSVSPYRFYVRMAYACAAVALAGFTPTYFLPLAAGRFAASPIVHLHGLLFFGWTLLFILQARSAAARTRERHRALGHAGIALSTAMLFAGVMVAVNGIEVGIAAGIEDRARAFSLVTITMVLSFAALVAAAIANVRRPAAHMRLMLAATTALLPPAIARLLFLVLAPPGGTVGAANPPATAMTLVPSVLADLLLVAAMVHDRRSRGRVHPAYVASIIGLLAVQLLRVPLATSSWWQAVTLLLVPR